MTTSTLDHLSALDNSSRRINRRNRPGKESPSCSATVLTESTSTSSSTTSSFRDTLLRQSSSSVDTELHRRLCPVTGVMRDIYADYHIYSDKIIGKGHYGMVRECAHLRNRDGEVLAVKSIDKSRVSRLDHIRREVFFLYQMEHDNIMKMIDCYEDAEFVHIVTEKYTGGELFDKISEVTKPTGCFSEEKAANIIKSLLEAIAYLHDNGVVHRDIKPENLLFETDHEDSSIKLIDFGLARKHDRGDTLMSNPVGTAYYMSPELLKGKYDRSCDVWSVGTIAYILLCGYPPFNGHSDPEIFKAIKRGHFDFPNPAWSDKSDTVKDFIKCLLKRDPKKRCTAKQALMHPWIRDNCVSQVVTDDEEEEDTLDTSATAKHDDIMARIHLLRNSIHRLKKSVGSSQR